VSLLPPGVPGYWRNETSGVLAPVVERYLHGGQLDQDEVAIMRAYLRQWVGAAAFYGPDIIELRQRVNLLQTHSQLRAWLADALDAGIDPL
jgi:hypothetical protein